MGKSSLRQITAKPRVKGYTIWLQDFRGKKGPCRLVGPGKASGRRWEQNEALKGGQISLGGGGTFQAGTGVGWSKVGFGDGDWPGGLERRVI